MSINPKKCEIGCDSFNFAMIIDGANPEDYMETVSLKTTQGSEFGSVGIKGGKVCINFCLPKVIWKHNRIPFGIAGMAKLSHVVNEIELALEQTLEGRVDDNIDVLSASARKIECNLTQWVADGCTCSHVINLLNRSHHEGTNLLYQRASSGCKFLKEDESAIIKKLNCYVLKCYDKSLEQRKRFNPEIDDGLLRIEVVMLDRVLKKLFPDERTIRDILTEQGLMKVFEEYKRIFVEDILRGYIRPCLKGITNILFESLKETGSPVETISYHKELIVDEEVLRKALKKWYEYDGRPDSSRQRIYDLKIYGFPKGAIQTLKNFQLACG